MTGPGDDRRTFLTRVTGVMASLPGLALAAPLRPPLRFIAPQANDRFGHYVVALLDRAAELLDKGYRFEALTGVRMTQRRIELEVASGKGAVDLMWGMSSEARRRELRRFEVMLDQGLIGWRVLVVRRSDLARWPRDLPVAQLRTRRAGQGLHWPDVALLRDNGYQVDTGVDMPTVYEMLRRGRIDYFPRSAMEVQDELAGLDDREFAIVPELALRYDTGNYIFSSRKKLEVADDFESALQHLQQSGELRQRFAAVFDAQLKPLELASRQVIQLRNTLE